VTERAPIDRLTCRADPPAFRPFSPLPDEPRVPLTFYGRDSRREPLPG
jgi:hypothetical protein